MSFDWLQDDDKYIYPMTFAAAAQVEALEGGIALAPLMHLLRDHDIADMQSGKFHEKHEGVRARFEKESLSPREMLIRHMQVAERNAGERAGNSLDRHLRKIRAIDVQLFSYGFYLARKRIIDSKQFEITIPVPA